MSVSVQAGLFDRSEIVTEESVKDSWCTPPEVMEAVHRFWPGGVALDPCSNGHAVALGFVRARVAWTVHDDCRSQPTWDVEPLTTCWLQPPYSRAGAPIVDDWARRWDAGQMHETLALVRLDTSTEAWAKLERRATSLVLFGSRLAHYELGQRKDASNICSAMLLITRSEPKIRHRALEAAIGDLGSCYR